MSSIEQRLSNLEVRVSEEETRSGILTSRNMQLMERILALEESKRGVFLFRKVDKLHVILNDITGRVDALEKGSSAEDRASLMFHLEDELKTAASCRAWVTVIEKANQLQGLSDE